MASLCSILITHHFKISLDSHGDKNEKKSWLILKTLTIKLCISVKSAGVSKVVTVLNSESFIW